MKTDVTTICLGPEASIREAMVCIEKHAHGVSLVVDEGRHLIGIITDGDIRRAILDSLDLDSSIEFILRHKATSKFPDPITAPVGTPSSELLHLMNQHSVRHIPLLDPEGQVSDLALLTDLAKGYESPMSAVIMAGGFGTRLAPLTEGLPKPMLPVGDKPLMERIVELLRSSGIRRVDVTTHYKPEAITNHFGDGKRFDIDIRYVEEEHPLGTAGAISLLDASDDPLLVINGDILTRVDFRVMLDFHREQQAEMTVAVRQHEFQIPYGVVETSGVEIVRLEEKPLIRQFINAGIYLLSPKACQSIPTCKTFDMTDLIANLLSEGRRVVSFPIHEYWVDIGEHADYKQAQIDVRNQKD